MSSQDPPDDTGKRGMRQTMRSGFQRAKDAFRRPSSPRQPAEGPERLAPLSLGFRLQTVFGNSTPALPTGPPPVELDRRAITPLPGSSTQASTHDSNVNNSIKHKKPENLAWSRLATSLHALESSVALFPPLQSAVSGLIGCLDVVQEAALTRTDYEQLAEELRLMADMLSQYAAELESEPRNGSIANIAECLQRQIDEIERKEERETIGRLLDAKQDQEDVIRRYRQVDRLFRQIQCDLTLRTKKDVRNHFETTLLNRMSLVSDAKYNSKYSMTVRRRACTEATREAVHQTLQSWTTNPDSEKIYWMNGMAGTGKTTIAYSFCEWLEATNRLGASFFCSRISSTCRSLSQIVPSIAYQLAHFSPAFRSCLCTILNDTPDAGDLNVVQQFERLINRPLLNAKSAMPDSVVVVIDALDECDDAYSVRLLLDVLLKFSDALPVKFFVASRPEPTIRDRMVSQGGAARAIVHLHDIEQSIVEEDIKKYLTEAFESMRPPPSDEQIAMLAKRSRNLFIYASTVVRYIHPDGVRVDSGKRLKSMLEAISDPKAMGKNKYEDLDRLYTTVLTAVFDAPLEEEERGCMQHVLWTVVCAKEPITVPTIASFASMDETQVWTALESLRSVVHVPESNTLISTLHASFPEYMLDQSRSGEFYCNESLSNQRLAHRLFEAMKSELRFNICKLSNSYLTDDQVPELDVQVLRCISPTLSYACRHWSNHMMLAPASATLRLMLLDLLSERLLFWIEVLNLCRCIGIGAPMMQRAQTWLRQLADTSNEIQKQVSDARNFITWFAANPCSRSTPHIYISALPLCAKSNWVYQHYSQQMRGVANLVIGQQDEAALATWIFESPVCSVATSPEGNRIAAGFLNGSIQVYDMHTGAVIVDQFKGHTDGVYSLMFSPDGSHIASGSYYGTVIVWDAHTGRIVTGPLKAHRDTVQSVAFSSDGDRIVTGSQDTTVIVSDVHSGNVVLGPLQHPNRVYSATYSPDGQTIASGSADGTIRLWNVSTGALVQEYAEAHKQEVCKVAFFPDGHRLASCSADKTIRLWDTMSGAPVGQPLEHNENIYAMAITSDGTQVVSAGFDWNPSIMVWDVRTGLPAFGPLRGHTEHIWSVAFSPDNTRIVSSSSDKTIRIWDVQSGNSAPSNTHMHESSIGSLAFSPDLAHFISNSSTRALQLWGLHTGAPISRSFEGLPEAMSFHSIAFSPRGTHVAANAGDGALRIWNVLTGEMASQPLLGHTDSVRCLAFSPDGTSICSGSDDSSVIVWDIAKGAIIGQPYTGHIGSVHSVAYSPDGTRIASGATDGTVRVWDPTTGTLIHTLSGHDGSVECVAFSPNGRYIVSGSDNRYVRRWEVDAPSDSVAYYCWDAYAVKCVAFSPDGTRIIAGYGSTIRVLDTELTEKLSMLSLPGDEKVHWVGFSTDHSIISVSASEKEDTQQPVEGTDQQTPQRPNIIRIWQVDDPPNGSDSSSASGTWSYESDGRIYSPDGLLLWVPPDIIRYIGTSTGSYRSSFVLSPDGIVDLRSKDLDLCIGERWTECYVAKD